MMCALRCVVSFNARALTNKKNQRSNKKEINYRDNSNAYIAVYNLTNIVFALFCFFSVFFALKRETKCIYLTLVTLCLSRSKKNSNTKN